MKLYRTLLCSTFLHQLLIYSVRPYVFLLADELGEQCTDRPADYAL